MANAVITMKTKIISHRGLTTISCMENSIAAINNAADLKIDMVEVDVRRTRDSQIICFHDPDIDGMLIRDLDYSDIIKLNSQIPTLEQILWSAKDKIGIEIEIKEQDYEYEVISIVLDYFAYDDFVMKSFNPEVVKKIKVLNSNITTGLLLGSAYTLEQLFLIINESLTCSLFKETKADFISPFYKIIEAGWCYKFSKDQVPIQAWTVNDEDSIRNLINQQVHSIVTDIPEVAIGIREIVLNES